MQKKDICFSKSTKLRNRPGRLCCKKTKTSLELLHLLKICPRSQNQILFDYKQSLHKCQTILHFYHIPYISQLFGLQIISILQPKNNHSSQSLKGFLKILFETFIFSLRSQMELLQIFWRIIGERAELLVKSWSLIQFIYIYILSSLKNMQLTGVTQQHSKKIKDYIYNYSDLIGSGNFSKVYKGINTKNQQIVAVKVVSLDALKSKRLEELVFQEIRILQQMNHPNILKFHEALLSERNCYIITELCNEGNLEDRLKQNKPFSEQQLSKIIAEVFQGLKYLREMNVCHRDLKPANIFMNNGQPKIADFGLAKFYKQKFKDLDVGSPLYMSPEGLIYNVYSQKTDVWAFGIVIYELIHGQTPFAHCITEVDLKTSVWRPIPQGKFKANINPQLRKFINSLLEIDQNIRPSFLQLANHPYIRSLNGVSQQKKSTKKLTVTESQKNQQIIQSNAGKIIELGGNKPNMPQKQKNFFHYGPNNYQHLHIPQSLKQERNMPPVNMAQNTHNINYQPPTVQKLCKRECSQKSMETKQSEEDRHFLRRQHRFRSIGRPL